MLWSAVNLLLISSALPPETVQERWRTLQSSLVALEGRGINGYAVAIDKRGYFLCHGSLAPEVQGFGKMRDGRLLHLMTVVVDEFSQLALLVTANKEPGADFKPVGIADASKLPGKSLIAVLSSGPVPGDCLSIDRLGIIKPSQRYVPLAEIRFEAQTAKLAGALVFNERGELAGALNAALEPLPQETISQDSNAKSRSFGPSGLTVGYMLGGTMLSRVVDGFRSPTHLPKHPTIGLFFRNAQGGGAEVVSFSDESTAKAAGVAKGDVIIRLDDATISGAFGLARVLFSKPVGATVELEIRSPGEKATKVVQVRVGELHPKSASKRVESK